MSATTPLRRLAGFARPHRRDVWLASTYSVLNKFFDVLPELKWRLGYLYFWLIVAVIAGGLFFFMRRKRLL